MSFIVPRVLKNRFTEVMIEHGIDPKLIEFRLNSSMNSILGEIECATWFFIENPQVHFSFCKTVFGMGMDAVWAVEIWPSGSSTENVEGQVEVDDELINEFGSWLEESKAELSVPDLFENFQRGRTSAIPLATEPLSSEQKMKLIENLQGVQAKLIQAATAEMKSHIDEQFVYLKGAIQRSQNVRDSYNLITGVLFPIVLALGQPELQNGFYALISNIFRLFLPGH